MDDARPPCGAGIGAGTAGTAGRHAGKRVLFVLPVCERGGGANVVFAEARAMAAMGVDARVVNSMEFEPRFAADLPGARRPGRLRPAQRDPRAGSRFRRCDRDGKHVGRVAPSAFGGDAPVLGYYAPGFRAALLPPGSAGYDRAIASYTLIPRLIRFTKTEWNAREVEARCGVRCAVVGPSVDTSTFRPTRPRPFAPPVRIAAMVRPSSPRRQPELNDRGPRANPRETR